MKLKALQNVLPLKISCVYMGNNNSKINKIKLQYCILHESYLCVFAFDFCIEILFESRLYQFLSKFSYIFRTTALGVLFNYALLQCLSVWRRKIGVAASPRLPLALISVTYTVRELDIISSPLSGNMYTRIPNTL